MRLRAAAVLLKWNLCGNKKGRLAPSLCKRMSLRISYSEELQAAERHRRLHHPEAGHRDDESVFGIAYPAIF